MEDSDTKNAALERVSQLEESLYQVRKQDHRFKSKPTKTIYLMVIEDSETENAY